MRTWTKTNIGKCGSEHLKGLRKAYLLADCGPVFMLRMSVVRWTIVLESNVHNVLAADCSF